MIATTDFRKAEQYTLSIRLTADGFCFSLYNPTEEKGKMYSYLYVEAEEDLSLCANLKKVWRQNEWLSYHFGQVRVVVESIRHTLVPLSLFEDEQSERLFHQCFTPADNELILYDILPKSNAVMLYGMDESAYDFLKDKYPDTIFRSKAGVLVDVFVAKNRENSNRKLFVDFGTNMLTIYNFDDMKLQLCNSQAVNQVNDAVYYLLLCWKSLGLNQELDELFLSGTLTIQEELLSLLRRYISKVSVISDSLYLDLQSVTSCG